MWPQPSGPFAAILVTPSLACLAVSFGADEATWAVLVAGVIALAVVAITAAAGPRAPIGRAAEFLSALQVVVGVRSAWTRSRSGHAGASKATIYRWWPSKELLPSMRSSANGSRSRRRALTRAR